MCGIAGYINLNGNQAVDTDLGRRMVASLVHRGPDEFGIFCDRRALLAQARLSIIDLSGGSQPLSNEDGTVWITYNGEIFNYKELRQDLLALGHRFATVSDTEVIVHAYEQWGTDCLNRFNGQFAFAVYDSRRDTVLLARDRLGIRPIFYTVHNNRLYFASEIKAIFCEPSIPRQLDLHGIDEVFTWWTTAPPRSTFVGINELDAGCYVLIEKNEVRSRRWWDNPYPVEFDTGRSAQSWADELDSLLIDAVRLRLRADVPVGAYLSGGLDSSATTALIREVDSSDLETFSVTFGDSAYDESSYQRLMADRLGTRHHEIRCQYADIAEAFPRVIYHTERPIIRTAPTPLMLLSGLVRDIGFKVVLTGEGADEILGGYDIFKETLIRSFWARNPESRWRPALLKRLYPTLPVNAAETGAFLEAFYKAGLSQTCDYRFSHMPRISTVSKAKALYSGATKAALAGFDAEAVFGVSLPREFYSWRPMIRAQYLEARSLLAGYILSSQGDRMLAANSVEGRFPFLDYRVVEFAAQIPPWHKILGLNEKYVLKRAMKKRLPQEILSRVKQPYMAPEANCFVGESAPDYVAEMLSAEAVAACGVFDPAAVNRLHMKCRKQADQRLSFRDNMSFVGVLSTQLTFHHFVENWKAPDALPRERFNTWIDQTRENSSRTIPSRPENSR